MRALLLCSLCSLVASTAAAEPLDFSSGLTRLPGVWYPTKPASAGTVRVEGGGRRIWFRGFTAVRHDTPFAPGADGAWTLRAKVDPVAGNQTSDGWVSFMLSPEPDTLGWVTAGENAVGILIRSNGKMQVFAREAEWAQTWVQGPPAPAATYDVELVIRRTDRSIRVEGRVNQARFTSEVTGVEPDDRPLFLSVGAHFHPGDVERSWVEDLEIRATPGQRRHRSR